jgi:hypothetical protein
MAFGLNVGDVILSKFWCGWGYKGAYQVTTGPFRIESITGPCTCAPYNTNWDKCCHLPSEPHFHLECTDIRPLPSFQNKKKGGSYLSGYAERDGRFVGVHTSFHPYSIEPHTDRPVDELFIVERAARPATSQLSLF